jgi:hypothetical protein
MVAALPSYLHALRPMYCNGCASGVSKAGTPRQFIEIKRIFANQRRNPYFDTDAWFVIHLSL